MDGKTKGHGSPAPRPSGMRGAALLRTLCFSLLAAVGSTVASAQGLPVEGSITVQETSEPVFGAAVYLVDSELRVVRAVLSDSVGDFHLTAPQPGEYSLRIERIGFETARFPPFTVSAGGIRDLRPVVQIRPIELDSIPVTAERVCNINEHAGDLVRVWTEARKVLAATVLSEARGDVEFVIEVRERVLTPFSAVVEEKVDTLNNRTNNAFDFVPIDQLGDVGWGRLEAGEIDGLYGPSPQILLSSWFTAHHCLSLASPSADSLVGLGFASIEGDFRIGIEGTFWLTNRSWLPRRVSFRFTGASEPGTTSIGEGEIELRAGDWGSWYVDSWHIRMPLRRVRRRGLFGGGRRVLVGYYERAGRLLEWVRSPPDQQPR